MILVAGTWICISSNTGPEISLERIKKRSRDGESNIPLDYLKALHERHESWLSSESNVLHLDVSNSIFEDEVMEEFFGRLKLNLIWERKKRL